MFDIDALRAMALHPDNRDFTPVDTSELLDLLDYLEDLIEAVVQLRVGTCVS